MVYLLDANVVINAGRDYYPPDRVPEFWDWLLEMGESRLARIPQEIYDEIVFPPSPRKTEDPVVQWIEEHRDTMVFPEASSTATVRRVAETGYGPDLSDEEFEQIGADLFLVAYAATDTQNRCVVTMETSKRRARRKERRVPDVCADLGVPCCDTFQLIRRLNFRTDSSRRGPGR